MATVTHAMLYAYASDVARSCKTIVTSALDIISPREERGGDGSA